MSSLATLAACPPILATFLFCSNPCGLCFSAKLVGYSKETIKYGEDEIIVSYEMYDKKIKEFKEEIRNAENTIELKRHIAMDTEEYFKDIHNYLKEQKDIDKKLLDKANSIERFLSEIQRKITFYHYWY